MRAWWLKHVRWFPRRSAGSALILTVVLTSLLAIVGVLFIMTTRLDKLGSSAALDNEQLELAVGSVVSQISQTLADDVPGMSGSKNYYDYPDVDNPWLADLEPCQPSSGTYRWHQITNLAGHDPKRFGNVSVSLIPERAPIVVTTSDPDPNADADGDGVSDARWYRLPGVVTTKGRPVYAAVRIIDNGGMLNLNTARGWDGKGRYDGTSQLQINLAGTVGGSIGGLDTARDLHKAGNLAAYEEAIIWKYPPWRPDSLFTPFDLSDELELRYRFMLNRDGVDCRAENWGQLRKYPLLKPVGTPSSDCNLSDWAARVTADTVYGTARYNYRHILTTYNMDRNLTPDLGISNKINVNLTDLSLATRVGPGALYQAVLKALARRGPEDSNLAAQITANLMDYVDQDNKVTAIANSSGKLFYGYERPCLCLSEVADCLKVDPNTGQVLESAAIEVFKPFIEDGDPDPSEWQVEVVGGVKSVIKWSGDRRFQVLRTAGLSIATLPFGFDPNEKKAVVQDVNGLSLQGKTTVRLNRNVGGVWVTVDSVKVPSLTVTSDPNGVTQSIQRDITVGQRIQRLWSPAKTTPNLGNAISNYESDSTNLIQAYPTNKPLINIGELGMVFRMDVNSIPSNSDPNNVLINLADSRFADLFNYLTVIDPNQHGQPAGVTPIAGRININTAPWPVLAALPWIQYVADKTVRSDNGARAQAIVKYRDKHGPYKSIGDLMRPRAERELLELQNLQTDKNDNFAPTVPGDPNGPDLTPDKVQDDLEERDIIFTRISDLVTVRSDVFTAYILVRIGEKGPQRRMIAILDRSQATPGNPKVRLVALHAVADPW
jgi:hypothetical protein